MIHKVNYLINANDRQVIEIYVNELVDKSNKIDRYVIRLFSYHFYTLF